MIILTTERLALRTMEPDDADFIVQLLNSPGWLKYIGDRGIKDEVQAREYLSTRVIPDYEKLGFGFFIVERLSDQVRVGNCGLTRRPGLEHVDIGYSLITEYEGHGYAFEAAQGILAYGFHECSLNVIQAITTKDNHRSQKLLEKLGLSYLNMVRLPNDDEDLMLYGITAAKETISL